MERDAGCSDSFHVDEDDRRSAAIVDFDLDHPIEDSHLDSLCRLVAQQCGMPVALVSLVDEAQQRFLGRAGTTLTCTPRSTSFCATAMLEPEILVIPDAREDGRFAHYTLVTGDPHIRFYAGAPLVSPENVPLGALCIIDTEPHPDGLSPESANLLRVMATAVMDHLLLRRAGRQRMIAADSAARALDESELRFRLLTDVMPQMVWSARADGMSDYFNARWYQFTGLAEGESDGDDWAASLHPDDLDRALERWGRSVATGEPYDIEYRMRRADGEYRWALARGLPMENGDGRIIRWIGTCTDIHEHKLAMEEREIISQELSHRIKNIFAVVSGLIGLAGQHDSTFGPTALALRERVLALGRAHDFVRPHSRESRMVPDLHDSLHGLLRQIFAPYEAGPGERIHIGGEDIRIDDRSATPLALLFHEMATNAAKYGALSTAAGQIDIAIMTELPDGHIVMTWREAGGPALTGVQPGGFGSQLLDLSVRRQLGGEYQQDWKTDGMTTTIRVPVTAFSRQPIA